MKASRQTLRHSRNNKLFFRFMLIFSLLVIFPSLAASTATYTYIVNKFEQEADRNHLLIKNQFSQEIDDFFSSLHSNMIHTIGSVAADSWIRMSGTPMQYERIEIQTSLEQRLQTLIDSKRIFDSAYIYVPESDKVLSTRTGSISAQYFFSYLHRHTETSQEKKQRMLTGRHMMSLFTGMEVQEYILFSEQLNNENIFLSAVVSYPFHSNSPSAYLVVNLKENVLREMMQIDHYMPFETAILDESGQRIAQSGNLMFDGREVIQSIAGQNEGESIIKLDNAIQLSFIRSNFNSWIYVLLIDLNTVIAPAETIKRLAVLFLIVCSVIGLGVSYLLSRNLYHPIWNIKRQFEQTGLFPSKTERNQSQNELQLINQWTSSALTEHASMNKKLTELKPIVHERLLNKLLTGDYADEEARMHDCREVDMPFTKESAKAVIVVEYQFLPGHHRDRSTGEQALIIEQIRKTILQEIEAPVWISQNRENHLNCIVHLPVRYKLINGKREAEMIQSVLTLFQTELTAALALGPVVATASELKQAYLQACELLEWKSLTRDIEFIGSAVSDERKMIERFLSEEDTDKIRHQLISADMDALAQTLSHLLDDMGEKRPSAKQLLQFCHDIINTLIRVLSSMPDQNVTLYAQWADAISSCASVEELKQMFTDVCADIAQIIEKNEDPESTLNEIMTYIQAHYMDELSMEMFAEWCKISLGHFSRSFKKAAGMKYVDYVARIRTRKARELLRETDMKIEQIALETGFISSNSFISTFKKFEGITPGKYRSIHN